jgi:hydrogenase maturation protein HypF
MLAYTPLHFHLFDEDLDLLVMTSANPSGLPIIKDNEEARSRLGEIADYFVLHDREIVNRCEDSVVRVVESDGRPDPGAAREPSGPSALVIPYRRSRGYAPGAIDVAGSLPGPVAGPAGSAPAATPAHTPTGSAFGAGGEMKSVFCFVRDGQAFLSPHLGEMDYVESLDAYRDAYERYSLLLDSPVALAGYDPHPGYLVSRLARRLAGPEAVHLPVYHHHAHMVSCLADNGLAGDSPVLGLICDGTGYGPDGAVWGFELLAGTAAGFTRVGHLANTFMPGGDVVARRPYRAAAAHLYRVLGKEGVERLARLRPDAREELHLAAGLLEAGARSGSSPTDRPACAPQDLTSSCGRLYDAVAAMAAVAVENTYEGQAAVELSEAGDFHRAGALEELMESPPRPYRFSVNAGAGGDGPHHSTAAAGGDGPILIDPQPFLTGLLADLDRERAVGRRGVDRRAVSRLFHRSLIEAMVGAVQAGAARTGLARVCLSGGTFQNPYLVAALRPRLEAAGLEVFTHRQVPPNDGGLALGQAVAAVWMARPQEELNPLVSGRSGTHHQP